MRACNGYGDVLIRQCLKYLLEIISDEYAQLHEKLIKFITDNRLDYDLGSFM